MKIVLSIAFVTVIGLAKSPAQLLVVKSDTQKKTVSQPANRRLSEILDLFKSHYKADILYADHAVKNRTVSTGLVNWQQDLESNLSRILPAAGLKYIKQKSGSFAIVPADKQVDDKKQSREPQTEKEQSTTSSLQPAPAAEQPQVQSVQRNISGKVNDQNNEPLPGVSVVVKGTQKGTITDLEGKYSISLTDDENLLVFSYVGYLSQEIRIEKQTTVDIILAADNKALDEVVVVGYGVQKKSSLTGAVATIKGEKVSEIGVSNVTDALQGRVAGMDIQASRYPGDNRGILIRGVRSLNAGNSPLVIIDGVPGDLNTLNPYDVESMEVLKDASASAIYGSRGANGVIIVSTKRGKGPKKTSVSYNAYYGTVNPNFLKLQSPEQYMQFRRDAYRLANGWENSFTDQDVFLPREMEVIESGNYTDWQKLLYRNGKLQNHTVTLNHGGEKTKINVSLTYNGETGYYKTNEQTKLNFSANLDHSVNSWFRFGFSSRLQNTKREGFSTYGTYITYMSPLAQPYNADGSFNFFPAAQNPSAYNVLANYLPGAFIDEFKGNSNNITFYTDLQISKKLSMRTNVGLISNANRRGYYHGQSSYERKGAKSNAGKIYDNRFEYTVNNILTYTTEFNGHAITADLVGEAVQSKGDNVSAEGTNQPVENTSYHNLGTSDENIRIGSGYSSWSLLSALARVRYDFKNKYFLNFAVRTDGSSRLAAGNKWSSFPSGGIGWLISEEKFFDISWLNTMKIRASYGSVGNTAIDPYQTLATLSKRDYLFGDDEKFFAYRPSSIASNQLSWEVSRTLNFGMDFGLFRNRISGYIEAYRTRTQDLLLQRRIPVFTGFSQIWQNIGSTQNTGLEISLQGNVINSGKFSWNVFGNYALNKEKIISLIDGNDIIGNNWFIGKPMGLRYDYEFDGIWQLDQADQAATYFSKPGDIRLKDQNGDGKIDQQYDRTILGTTRPVWTAALGSDLRYGNLSLSFSLNSRWDYLIRPAVYSSDIVMDGLRWIPASFDYWTPDNPSNKYQKADAAEGYDPHRGSSGYMKGDHIKLQDLTLGYDFKDHFPGLVSLSNARIYFQMKNALYLYRATPRDITPEASELDFNIPRTYMLGISVGF